MSSARWRSNHRSAARIRNSEEDDRGLAAGSMQEGLVYQAETASLNQMARLMADGLQQSKQPIQRGWPALTVHRTGPVQRAGGGLVNALQAGPAHGDPGSAN